MTHEKKKRKGDIADAPGGASGATPTINREATTLRSAHGRRARINPTLPNIIADALPAPPRERCASPSLRTGLRLTRATALGLVLILTTLYLFFPASTLASSSPAYRGSRRDVMNHVRTNNGLILQVNAGFDERYRNGDWVPLHITLSNNGPDFSGTLSTSNPLGPVMQAAGFTSVPVSTYQQPIMVRHGTQQQITMYLPLYTFFGPVNIPVQLLDTHGKLLLSQSASLYALNEEDVFVGLLTDQTPVSGACGAPCNFSPLQALALPSQSGSVKIQFLDASTLPDMAKVLSNFNLIVLDDFTTSHLSHQQIAALGTWVNQGGALIEIGGAQWQRTLASLPASLLPVSIYGTSTINVTLPDDTLSDGQVSQLIGGEGLPFNSQIVEGSQSTSVSSTGVMNHARTPITVSIATVHAGARTILSAGATPGRSQGVPLLVQAQHGQGNISFLAFDPTSEPIQSWSGATALWKALLFRSLGEQIVPTDNGPSPGIDISYGLAKLQHALLPYTSPTAWVLVLVFVGYLLILGPLRWLVIRSFKRRAWSWRISLSAIVIFSLFNYGLALYQQGTSMFSNSLSIISLGAGEAPYGSFAHSTSYVGIYVPFVSGNGNVQVHFPTGRGQASSLLVQPFTDFVLDQQPATIATSPDGTDVNLPAVDLRALNAFQVEQDLPLKGKIASHLTLAHGELTGTVTNTLPTTLRDVYVLMPNSIVHLGTLGPNQTIHIVLALPVTMSAAKGLPTCGSLVNQLTASSGGLPAGYNQLFYHDIDRPLSDKQRHVSFLAYLLNAMQCNLSPNSPATLIGWADQPLDTVSTLTLNGVHPDGLHETLLVAPLDLTFGAASLALPADGLSGQLVDAEAASIRRLSTISYVLMKGQMTFEYTVPTLGHIQRLTLTQPADSSAQSYSAPGASLKDPAHLALYNWQTASWNAITLTPSTSFSTQNLNAYLGPDGQLLLQCVNQQADLGIIAFTKPILTVTSN
jgi:hypothetical protein